MIFSWFKSRRRKKLLAQPFPEIWLAHLASNVRHYQHLEPSDQALVRNVVQVFVAEKHWAGGGGLSVTDEMKVTVAAQASLLVLGSPQPYYYDQVPSVILHPRRFVRPRRVQDNHFIVWEDREISGEAWYRGPIVLSWEDVLAGGRDGLNGYNLVLHEFAHHLDGLDGQVDGEPILSGPQRQERRQVIEAEYLRLVGSAQRKEITLLRHYGATNRAEFFAVATECFFEQPHAMKRLHKELYGILQDFYLQDPAQWCPDARMQPHCQYAMETDTDECGGQDHVREAELGTRLIASRDIEDLFALGVECLDSRHYRLAVEAFSRVIELDPSDAEAYQRRAMARTHLAEYAEALNDAQKALRVDEDDVAGYLSREAAYLGLRQYERARKDFDRVLSEEGNNAEAYYLRGLVWVTLGKLRQAVSDFSLSVAIRPCFADAYYHRAHTYRRLGRSAKADSDLEKAFQLDPDVGWRK